MALQKISNVTIRGIAACAPSKIEENKDIPVFNEGEAERVIAQTSIERKRVVEYGTTAADLCEKACNTLIEGLQWERESIDILVFVTSASDYNVPPTVCVLQDKLKLSESTLSIELRHGCPGWVIGLSTIASLLSNGDLKRGILLCGDTPTLLNSSKDKETRPLFGDAGSATAIEFDTKAQPLEFELGTRGKDYKAICAEFGGYRNPTTKEVLDYVEYGPHRERRPVDIEMDGMSVFGFGLSVAPRSISNLAEHFSFNLDSIDCFLFHQANHYMNEKIRKKLHIPEEKVPYSMQNFGNTSCASIPLTIVTERRKNYVQGKMNSLACAFGVGLAWGSVHFVTERIVCPELIEY